MPAMVLFCFMRRRQQAQSAFPEARYDMVRIGLGLYGLSPSPTVQCALELVPAIALVSRIVNIQTHQQGDRIGYNGTFVVPQDGFRKAVSAPGLP